MTKPRRRILSISSRANYDPWPSVLFVVVVIALSIVALGEQYRTVQGQMTVFYLGTHQPHWLKLTGFKEAGIIDPIHYR